MGTGVRQGIRGWLVLLVLVSAVPVALFSGLTVYRLALIQREAAATDLREHAQIAAAAISQRIDTVLAVLNTLAVSGAAQRDDLPAFHAHARRTMAGLPEAVAIVLIGRNGENLFNTNVDWGQPLPAIPERDVALEVFRTAKPAISKLFVGPVRMEQVVAVHAPVIRNGQVAYVLRITVRPEVISTMVVRQRVPGSWTMAVVDQSGIIIGRNREPERFIGTAVADKVSQAIARNDAQIFSSVTLDGVEVEAIVTNIKPWPWWVAIGVSTTEMNAVGRRSLMALGLGGLLLCGIGFGLALWLSRRLTHEVKLTSEATMAFGHGKDPAVRPSAIRELDRIGAAIGAAKERQDVTAAELAALSQSEQRLAEANAALAANANELARSNADLEQFAYVASHDLREPLRMISSYLSLLGRRYTDRLDQDGHEFLAFARDGAKRMDQMVLDLLDYSRVGRTGGPEQPVDLGDAANEAIANLAVMIAETSAVVRATGDFPIVRGARNELVRLVQNLIENALKYRHPDRAAMVTISTRSDQPLPEGADEDEVTISVADNGIGIAPEFFERIFNIFQRLHTRDQYDGTGIGLAVCRKIVLHHGGKIWVESEPQAGTTVLFTLRRAPGDSAR